MATLSYAPTEMSIFLTHVFGCSTVDKLPTKRDCHESFYTRVIGTQITLELVAQPSVIC